MHEVSIATRIMCNLSSLSPFSTQILLGNAPEPGLAIVSPAPQWLWDRYFISLGGTAKLQVINRVNEANSARMREGRIVSFFFFPSFTPVAYVSGTVSMECATIIGQCWAYKVAQE